MSIDKSFEKCLKSIISEEAYNFMNNYEGITKASALGYFQGFTDGQKTLSPEVRQVLKEMLYIIGECEKDYEETVFRAKKLLEDSE